MKILFVPFTPSLAHMTRCLSIAETMKAENNECLFAVGIEGKNFIEKAGFPTYIIPEVDSETFKNDRGWKWINKRYFLDNLYAEQKIIDKFKPDYLIYDFRFTTSLSARINSTKSISILHASALSLVFDTKKTAIDIISSFDSYSNKSLREKLFQFIFSKVFCWVMQKPIKRIKMLLKQYNYDNIKTIFNLLPGEINFIADIPEFISDRLKLPDNYYVVGPLTWSGWEKDDIFSLKELDSKPVIYVTMGSTEAKPTLLKLVKSLQDLPYNIIISKGKTELDLPDAPKNVFLYSYVPGKIVASKSSLVIYHGGHETLMQVLSCGIPSLVIPVNPDQILIAKLIKKHGIGNYLKHPNSFPMEQEPLKNYSKKEITEEVIRIIDDSECKRRCEILKKTIVNYIDSKEYLRFIK